MGLASASTFGARGNARSGLRSDGVHLGEAPGAGVDATRFGRMAHTTLHDTGDSRGRRATRAVFAAAFVAVLALTGCGVTRGEEAARTAGCA